jgi:hypothetical protein
VASLPSVRAGSFLFTVLKPGLPDDRFCAILYCHDSAGFFIVGRSPWQKTGRATIVGPTHRTAET